MRSLKRILRIAGSIWTILFGFFILGVCIYELLFGNGAMVDKIFSAVFVVFLSMVLFSGVFSTYLRIRKMHSDRLDDDRSGS